MSRILVVEDEPRLAAFLEKGLRSAGLTITVAEDGPTGARLARDEDFDLVLLDVGLPGQDGFSVLRSVRSRGERLPVIMLTARSEIDDTVAGLDSGADDYVTKPFVFEELLARVRARLRTDERTDAPVLRAGEVELDVRRRRATFRGDAVELTAREYTMLETFLRHEGQVLSREQLLSHVWGYDYDPRPPTSCGPRSRSAVATSRCSAPIRARWSSRRPPPWWSTSSTGWPRIVEDMITLARMEDPGSLRMQTVELERFVSDVATKASGLLDGRLRVHPPTVRRPLRVDSQRMTQALINLLKNAEDHTSDGGPIDFRVTDEAGAWRFEVSDQGGGLPPGEEQQVFRPFHTGTRSSGSGLGLAIVNGIARAHGGSAGVENRPGAGATFWVRVPQ